jgi:multidrug resistance efflux pump
VNDKPLPPIPTPLLLRWREFRVRALPILFFVAALGSVCIIWQRNLTAPMLVGAVEVRSAAVSVPYAGKILQLDVNNFEMVTQGQPVAVLVPTDPRLSLSVLQAELSVLQIQLGLPQTQQRIQTSFDQLRENWMRQRVDLATARVNLELARDQLQRDDELLKQKLISESDYEIASKAAQALDAEVFERSNLVETTSAALKDLEFGDVNTLTNETMQPLLTELQSEENKVTEAAASVAPFTLFAPMTGEVNVLRQPGENLVEGAPVVTITATQPKKIISYLRQPIPFEPKVGMKVEVRSRSLQSQTAIAEITGVGSHFENITNALAMTKFNTPYDLGLPIEINVPAGLKIRPGELVDLNVRSAN